MHSAFDPASPQAGAVAHLWWWMFGAGSAIWLLVVATMLYASLVRPARRTEGGAPVRPGEEKGLERAVSVAVFGALLILCSFLAYDFTVGQGLARHPQRPVFTVDVVGHQWWWEVQYENPDPSRRVVTANEIHVPVGAWVQVKLRAADVIHSFWAPSLNGKRDLIPGYASSLWFRADTAGIYRGQCAEFCGMQHAKMAFLIVAEPRAAFDAWLAAAAKPSPPPGDATSNYGLRVFASGPCAACHTIAGTDARGTVGPDLSHLATRRMIAAATLPNTRDNLMGWVVNPQAIKPGVLMPAVSLGSSDLTALVAYLETLR